ncbi:energy transducer TonB [Gelidibacter maritimus]|uniref:Energy transducer TonB n=1 Tax=Gelidibacter maritimus TaxID=2761487 RepID=A0A7W2R2X9_9FLAO|nr:energy transducer TonB [Gelidibacter maritimus]MBA6152247.1 energy transducer TonB [Gelidibacter maritimus]
MKIFKNSCIAAGQSNMRRKKPHKHDANLRKNSALYFQVGLILCLLFTYGLFEMKFEIKNDDLAKVDYIDTDVEVMPINFALEKEVKEIEITKNSMVLTKDPIIKDDDYVEMLPTELLTENKTLSKDPINIDDIIIYKKDDSEDLDLKVFSTLGVERAPVYPGCESEEDNQGRLKCMSDKLSKLVQRKFDRDMASTLGLSGIQKIDVVFKINKLGEVTEIQTRAPRPELEREAKRVVEQIPQMMPGKQRERAVTVQYVLPIIFKVE